MPVKGPGKFQFPIILSLQEEDMIVVENLVKRYGSFTAVDGLNLHVEEGQVVGLLGPNGAGKSTTMNIITGYISATSGTVLVGGHDVLAEPKAAKKMIGYMPEIPPLYTDMTVLSYLRFAAELKGVSKKERPAEVKRVMQMTQITDRAQKLIGKLSKGYRQRVGLAAALLNDPPILILDEPTVGLDPSQVVEIRELIRSLGKDHTVILSSHILSEVSEVCDHIIIIDNGKVIAEDTPENLSKQYSNSSRVYMEVKGSGEDITAVLDGIDYVDSYELGDDKDGVRNITLMLKTSEDKDDDLFFAFAKHNLPVRKVSHEELSLEEVFLKLTSEAEKTAKDEKKESGEADSEKAEESEDTEAPEEEKTQDDSKEEK